VLRQQGVETTLAIASDLDIDPDTEVVVFRAAQEALRNISKHAGASRAEVHVTQEDGHVVLVVSDDGRGFSAGDSAAGGPEEVGAAEREAEGHLGLVMLRDLAADAGGTLSLRSAPDAGSTVRLEVPA
jgi:two-component system NarL family sensor kinase